LIIAHLADLHLGYRAYHRLGPGGTNARERDVAQAFRAALDEVIALEVDLVVVAGDVFHTVRPSNAAIADAFRQFARLRAALPGTPVVVIAGNHDSPRAVETGSILRLLAEIPGVHVADESVCTFRLPELDAAVVCLPHNALVRGGGTEGAADGGGAADAGADCPVPEPDGMAAVNVLVAHGTVVGGGAEGKLGWLTEYGGGRLAYDAIAPHRWEYVALGHYHLATELAPNMWYAGGLERTSTNIWEEAAGAKGFVTWDTERKRAGFHPVPGREVLELPALSARDDAGALLRAEELDARIRDTIDAVPGGIGGKIARLVIRDIPRELFRELDHRRIREWRAEALHLHLDARRPEMNRVTGTGAPGRRLSLEEEVEAYLLRHWQPTSAEVQRERLVALAHRYLAEAARGEAVAAAEAAGGDAP
jgi:DNA repair protein SbcD/Mre11